jgi:hypothetical protein
MKKIQKTVFIILVSVAINIYANKAILFQNNAIIIYTDNTVVYADGSKVVFEPSSTWVEEDFFTQQEKYCEVDFINNKKLKQTLIKNH